MIIDALENFGAVSGFPCSFEKVLDFIESHDLAALPAGKVILDGDLLWLNVDEVKGRSEVDACLETHDRYIDIQIPLTTTETFGWQSRKKLKQPQLHGYQAEKDITFYNDQPALYFGLAPGNFVIFFPEDAHAPCIGETVMKKIVIKMKR